MACSEQAARDISSDPGRFSSWIRVVVHVSLAFCGCLCAILSVATVRLVKSSRIFQYFVSCDEGEDCAVAPVPAVRAATGTHLAQALLRGVVRVHSGRLEGSENVQQQENGVLITSSCSGVRRKTLYRLEDSISSSLSVGRNEFHENGFRAECLCGCPLLVRKERSEESLLSPIVGTDGATADSGDFNLNDAECLCRRCGKTDNLGGGKRLVHSGVEDDETGEIRGSSTLLRLGNGDKENLLRRRRRKASGNDEIESHNGFLEDDDGLGCKTKKEKVLAVGDVDSSFSRVGEEEGSVCECMWCSSGGMQNGSRNGLVNGITAVVTDGPGGGGLACVGSDSSRKKRARAILCSESSPTRETEVLAPSSPSSRSPVGVDDVFCSCSSSNPECSSITKTDDESQNSNSNWDLILNMGGVQNRNWGSAAHGVEREGDEDSEHGCRDGSDWKGRACEKDATDGGKGATALTLPESPPNRRGRGSGVESSQGWMFPQPEEEDGGGYGYGGEERIVEQGGSSVKELQMALLREKSAMTALYEELEEEREAASVAASEAMAMINRLQEEKAAVQMEARQYQRMAEERQEYDQEAMSMLEEILMRRDEEMSALEEEVNSYRTRLLSAKVAENLTVDAITPKVINVQDIRQVGSKREFTIMEGDASPGNLSSSSSFDKKRKSSFEELDEKLMADIKEWLRAAKEKGLPAKVEDLDIAGSFWRVGSSVGRKNLLESFCSVAVEESQRDGVEIEEVDTARPCPPNWLMHLPTPPLTPPADYTGASAGSCQEVSLKDDGISPDTLGKGEKPEQQTSEQRLGSKERVGGEEELIRILKSRIVKIEETETKALEAASAATVSQNQPSPSNVEHGVSQDDDERISEEEKRVSVLETVWKFEEQLHHLGTANNPPPLVSWKSGMSPGNNPSPLLSWKSSPAPSKSSPISWRTGFPNADSNSPQQSDSTSISGSKGVGHVSPPSADGSDSDGRSKKGSVSDKHSSVRSRLRRLANGAKNVALRTKRDRSSSSSVKEVRYDAAQKSIADDANEFGSKRVFATYDEMRDHPYRHPTPNVALPANPFNGARAYAQAQAQGKPRQYIPEANMSEGRGLGRTNSVELSLSMAAPASELVRGEVEFSQQLANCTESLGIETEESLDSNHHADGLPLKREAVEQASTNGEMESMNRMRDCVVATPEPGVSEQQREDWAGGDAKSKDCVESSGVTAPIPADEAGYTLETNGHILHGDEPERDEVGAVPSTDDTLKPRGDSKQLLMRRKKRIQEVTEQVSSLDSLLPNDSTGFIKDLESINGMHPTGQTQASKLARQLIRGGDPGTCRGDHMVGLSRLLQASPQDQQRKPIERARYFKAVDVS